MKLERSHETENQAPPQGEASQAALDYVLGEMAPAEAAGFERRLSQDEGLRREVQAWRDAVDAGEQWAAAPPPGAERAAAVPIPRVAPPAAAGVNLFHFIRPEWAWAIAATIVAGMLGALALGGGKAREHRMIAAAEGAVVTTPAAKVKFAVARGTQYVWEAKSRRIRLDAGAAWFWVAPGGEGLVVETPYGEAIVKGTVFGVAVDESAARVEVAKGVVATLAGGASAQVTAGEQLALGASGLGAVQPRPDGKNCPKWTADLLAAEQNAQFGAMLPSIQDN